jgi:hypothetical protein
MTGLLSLYDAADSGKTAVMFAGIEIVQGNGAERQGLPV